MTPRQQLLFEPPYFNARASLFEGKFKAIDPQPAELISGKASRLTEE